MTKSDMVYASVIQCVYIAAIVLHSFWSHQNMGPEVHHLCLVSGISVEGATGESTSSTTFVEIGTEWRNFWPLCTYLEFVLVDETLEISASVLPCARDGNSWFMKSYGIAAHCCRKLFLARWLMDAFVKLNSAGCGWSHGTLVCSLCWLLARLASRAARTVTGEWFLHFWAFHLICTTYDKGGVFWNGVLAIVCVVQLVHMGEILLLLWMVLGVCGLQVTDWPLGGCLLSCRE